MNSLRPDATPKRLTALQSEIVSIQNELQGYSIETERKGTIVMKMIRCGKTNCRCMNGGRLHGPYPHLQWWDKGKIKTKYLNRKIFKNEAESLATFKRIQALSRQLRKLQREETRTVKQIEKLDQQGIK